MASVVVGRREELAALEGALADVERGDPRAVGLRGEPGIGKSRLLAELAERARERGVLVLGEARGRARARSDVGPATCSRWGATASSPRALARTHGRLQTPHIASGVLAIALALYIGAFQLADASPDAALLKLAIVSPPPASGATSVRQRLAPGIGRK